MRRYPAALPLTAALLMWLGVLCALLSAAEPIRATVVAVYDGDTITAQAGDERIRVRLNAIDAPELKQTAGRESRDFLRELCLGQEVTLRDRGRDRYRRMIADVTLANGRRANTLMVDHGWAWHFTRYSDSRVLSRIEERARQKGCGLWDQERYPEAPEAPWDYRARIRRERKEARERMQEAG